MNNGAERAFQSVNYRSKSVRFANMKMPLLFLPFLLHFSPICFFSFFDIDRHSRDPFKGLTLEIARRTCPGEEERKFPIETLFTRNFLSAACCFYHAIIFHYSFFALAIERFCFYNNSLLFWLLVCLLVLAESQYIFKGDREG